MATKAAHKRDIPEGRRLCKEIAGRTVTIFQHKGKFHCVDANCYHMGGPVGAEGDIEDLGGRVTIRCPWHGHKICVDTGGILEQGLGGEVSCSHTQHRVHNVYHDTDGWLWVNLMESWPKVRSDQYNRQQAAPARMSPEPSRRGFGLSAGFQWAPEPTFGLAATGSPHMSSLRPYCGEDKLVPIIDSPARARARSAHDDVAMDDTELPETLSQEAARLGGQQERPPGASPQPPAQPEWSAGTVSQHFRTAKSGSAMAGTKRHLRNEAARMAISRRQIQPPTAPVAAAGARQASIKEFFPSHPTADTVAAMEM
eukprot:jgi/Tetstr1/438213/TSEL_002868.t1